MMNGIHAILCLNLEDEWNTCYTLSEFIVWFFIISVFWTNIVFQCRDSVWTTKHKNAVIIFTNWQYFILGSKKLTVCVGWSRINATFVLLSVVVSKYLSFRWILYLTTETLCLNKKNEKYCCHFCLFTIILLCLNFSEYLSFE